MASKVGRGTSSICGPSSLMAASSLKAPRSPWKATRGLAWESLILVISFRAPGRLRCLSGRGIDDGLDSRDSIRRKASLPGMLPHHLFVGSNVHAIDLVAGDIAFLPLDPRPQAIQHAAGFFRDGPQLLRRHVS